MASRGGKEGVTVYYSLTSPYVAGLLAAARQILSGVLAGRAELLEDPRTADPPMPHSRRAAVTPRPSPRAG